MAIKKSTVQKYMAVILENGQKRIIAKDLDIPTIIKKIRYHMSHTMWPEEMTGYVIPDGVLKQRDDGVPYGWIGCVYVPRFDSKHKPVFAYTVRKKGESLDKVSEDYTVKADGTLLKGKW